jgi:hypothetical protein
VYSARLKLVALACLITLLNCVKPLATDDSVYYHYARHIAEHPLDPYGFRLYEQPANEILAPPGLLYWWAGALRLFGERPFLWKLSLLPFSLLFVASLYALCRRFARGLEMPLVCLTALSPALLPCLNLMLDVPALALSLAALAIFFRACDNPSAWRACATATAAGLLAGLAIETKYTGFVAPVVLLLYAVLYRRVRLGLLAACLALLLFIAWESFTACAYGESHFVHALRLRGDRLVLKARLAVALVGLLGGPASAHLLLGLLALRLSRAVVLTVAGLLFLGLGLVAGVPEGLAVLVSDPNTARPVLTINNLVFGGLGISLAVTAGAAAWRLCRFCRSAGETPAWTEDAGETPALRQPTGSPLAWMRRLDGFLVLWLMAELTGYFVLTPYPAVRRILGVVTVLTLLLGRLAARTCVSRPRRALVWGAAVVSALTGLLAFAVDFSAYRTEERLAGIVEQYVHERDPGARIWYVSPSGGAFCFYADRLGLGWLTPRAALRPGDWIAVLEKRYHEPTGYFVGKNWIRASTLAVEVSLPLRSCYQYGSAALAHSEGAVAEMTLYRPDPHDCPP